MEQAYQVVIVGGGPVGVALAVDLGLRGVSCALVERHLVPQRIPKGQNLTQRSLEHFYFWGIADDLRNARLLPPGYPIGGITAYGNLMSEYWYSPAGREAVGEYYFQTNERLPQYLTEEVLRRRLGDLPSVTRYFGWSAERIEQDESGVRITICSEEGTTRQALEAEYVVGCDGARSSVREQLALEQDGTDFDQRMVLIVFRSPELHEGLKRFPDKTTFRVLNPALKGVWQFFGRIDVGEGWFFHAPVPRDATVENYDFHGLLQQAAGFYIPCNLEHIGFWELRVAIANSYRQGRGFIAGDAAHSHPPYGAFGLNSGLEDVVNLGWKLAASLEGWGGEPLLDSYSEERQPVFVATGEGIIAGGIKRDRTFLERYNPECDRNEFEAAWTQMEVSGSSDQRSYDPHYEGSPVVIGLPNASSGISGSYSFAARAGHHLAPQVLSSGRNIFEELERGGFNLLAFGADEQSVEVIQQTAKVFRMPLKVIRDTYNDGRKMYGARLILVRPDQYVAWSGDKLPDDSVGLMRKVAGTG